MPPSSMKKIFLSDIHLGDARSFAKPNPYGWFRQNLPHLENFLLEHLDSPDVSDVVILGDLFDTWVVPTHQDPLTSFQDICTFKANLPVITALRNLAAKRRLTYIPGNHDMVLSSEAQHPAEQFLSTQFPGIKYNPDPTLPFGIYRSGHLVAEHGNRYGLFNAPDTWTHSPYFLPLGYFISRLVAYKVHKTGTKENFHHIFPRFVLDFIDKPEFIHDLLTSVAHDAGLKKTDSINLTGIDNYPPTIDAIGTLYNSLIEKWQEKRRDLDWRKAVAGDIGQLLLAAAVIYFSQASSPPKIVIFGHSHKAELWKNYQLPVPGLNFFMDFLIRQLLLPALNKLDLLKELGIPKLQLPDYLKNAPMLKDVHLNLPCRAIYVNCGTWIDSAPHCTYVETQEDPAANRHYVRLLNYPGKKVLQAEYVNLR